MFCLNLRSRRLKVEHVDVTMQSLLIAIGRGVERIAAYLQAELSVAGFNYDNMQHVQFELAFSRLGTENEFKFLPAYRGFWRIEGRSAISDRIHNIYACIH